MNGVARIHGLRSWGLPCGALRGSVVWVAFVAAVGGSALLRGDEGRIEFLRVHVPRPRLGDVPLGAGRYVPMAVDEFDAIVAQATAPQSGDEGRPRPLVTSARYVATVDDQGRLEGTLTCEVSADRAATQPAIPLGPLSVVVDTPDGRPNAEVFGTDGQGLFLRTPAAGTYSCRFVLEPDGPDSFVVPLVPAVASTLSLRLPADLRPVTTDPAAVIVAPTAAEATWRIDVGPRESLAIRLVARDRPARVARRWTTVLIRGRDAEFTATVVPEDGWGDALVFERHPKVTITAIETEPGEPLSWQETAAAVSLGGDAPAAAVSLGGDAPAAAVSLGGDAPAAAAVSVALPSRLEGSVVPLRIRGVLPASGDVWRLPLVRLPATVWAGGGMIVRLDPTLAATAIDLHDCRVITPEAAAGWPVSQPERGPGGPPLRPAIFHIEEESALATTAITVQPRAPTFDVARVTTVEISPEAVLSRVACDVRVVDGEAFELVGRLAPDWVIDSVEAAAWPANGDVVVGSNREASGGSETPCDWRTVRSPAGATLRIAWPMAATPEVVVGLWIRGHRPRIPIGETFSTADIDMVRFPGESADSALIDFKVGSEALVEIAGEPAPWLRSRGRLASLIEEGTLRARVRGSDQAPDREARVVQRRPPLDADVEVRLDARDELLVESFTFTCRPEAGGVEAVVVHFSEPMGEPLTWSVVSPADVTISAQRVDSGVQSDVIAESWLVECTPPIDGSLVVRAVRTLPFIGALPVPLAWVEGDTSPGGTVVLTAVGGPRPELVSRRLRELPAGADPDRTDANRAEYAFGPPLMETDGMSAADVVPASTAADTRGWAWREDVTCWCEESGTVECASRFDLENHGRAALTLSVPAGRTVERVLIDGVDISIDAAETAGPTLRIPLPVARRRVDVRIRTRSVEDPGLGLWVVDPLGCSIDVPVLERDIRLRLPPGLDASWAGLPGSAYREVRAASRGWLERLFGPAWHEEPARPATEPIGSDAVDGGFRERRFIVTGKRQPDSGILVVRRRLLGSATILAAAAAAALAWIARGRLLLAATVCMLAAVAALWAPAPFDSVPRVALWAAVTSLAVGRAMRLTASRFLTRLRPATAVATGLLLTSPLLCAAEPYRVFIDHAPEGPLALVPEPLYRLLADAAAPEAAAVRLLTCRVTVAGRFDADPWRLELDIEADAGGMLVLDQAPGRAVWIPPDPGALPPGIRARVEGSRLRLTAATEGRRRLTIGLVPAVSRRGMLETASIRIPMVPAASVALVDADGVPLSPPAGSIACDRSTEDGPWLPAAAVTDAGGDPRASRAVFDVSGARRVRLLRPLDPRQRIATGSGQTRSINDVAWNVDGCSVTATLDVDGGADIVRWFVVQADERLEDLETAVSATAPPRLTRLDRGRLLVEPREAVAGSQRITLTGRMPLPDPVGSFVVPAIWPETATEADCTLKLTSATALEATLEPMPAGGESRPPQPRRLTVRRRREAARGQQTLLVDMAGDRTLLLLSAQIEALGTPLTVVPVDVPPGSVVDRVTMTLDEAGGPPRPVDLSWSRTAVDRISVVLQQPRAGRFRLTVDVRLPVTPANQGRIPVARALLDDAAPLLVTWQGEPRTQLVVTRGADEPLADTAPDTPLSSIELFAEQQPPVYRITRMRDQARMLPQRDPEPRGVDRSTDRSTDHGDAPVIDTGLLRTEISVGIDRRGRLRGLVRFDLTSDQPVLRLRLPAGMRLFDVLVDGREVPALPRDNNAWDVRVQAVAWPRSVIALFIGDLGDAFVGGGTVRLEPPTIDGFPGGPVWWTLAPSDGFTLRVSEPAERLEPAALEAARAEVRQRLDAAFDRALAVAAEPERRRLEPLAALRRVGAPLPAEAAWERAAGWPGSSDTPATTPAAGSFIFTAGDDGGLTLRAVRAIDRNASERAVVTAALILALGVAWVIGGRRSA
jgi:hypothetical protein